MRVTAEVKQATEQAIRAAARKLFAGKGLGQTSTREIAAGAKIAVGTLFNYFASKEALAMAIAGEAFASGSELAMKRLESSNASVEEDLFSAVACDIRALEPNRSFIADVLEAGLSPLAAGANQGEAGEIRTERLELAARILARHGLAAAATPPVMHLYWSLYLGILSYWARDASPKQEDTWALLDQGVRMFAGSLRRASDSGDPAAGVDSPSIHDVSSTSLGVAAYDAPETNS